uniref:Uncharacterized protein n=1 Tax=Steinernema glaseri TaxID=37863 RepID=A0A1I7XYB6_9BILA
MRAPSLARATAERRSRKQHKQNIKQTDAIYLPALQWNIEDRKAAESECPREKRGTECVRSARALEEDTRPVAAALEMSLRATRNRCLDVQTGLQTAQSASVVAETAQDGQGRQTPVTAVTLETLSILDHAVCADHDRREEASERRNEDRGRGTNKNKHSSGGQRTPRKNTSDRSDDVL